MKTNRYVTLLSASLLACVALPSEAADRVHAGQWDGTWTGAGRTRQTSNCMTQADADAMNGDVKSVRTHLEKVIPPSICTLTDIKISGDRITYTAACKGGTTNIVSTKRAIILIAVFLSCLSGSPRTVKFNSRSPSFLSCLSGSPHQRVMPRLKFQFLSCLSGSPPWQHPDVRRVEFLSCLSGSPR